MERGLLWWSLVFAFVFPGSLADRETSGLESKPSQGGSRLKPQQSGAPLGRTA